MATQRYHGSIILKLLIVLSLAVLVAVIYIPGEIWKEEEYWKTTSRNNMNSIFEAESFYYSKNKLYVPADSLEKLVQYIRNDSTLQSKQRIGVLTHLVYDSLSQILNVPLLNAILPISQSLEEIKGDLEFNTRYFQKYDYIMAQKQEIEADLPKFNNSINFPNFCAIKIYADSLNMLRDRISDYELQFTAQLARRYVDSIMVYAPGMEKEVVYNFWKGEHQKISKLVADVKKTDIMLVSSVADRLKKFVDRINNAFMELQKVNVQESIPMLRAREEGIEKVYETFLEPENFLITKENGLMQLSEVDSILIKFNESNFMCPDTFDGPQFYIIAYKPGNSNLVVESPNLLGFFQNELQNAVAPIRNLSTFPAMERLQKALDSTAVIMDQAKSEYRLARYSTDLLLNMKELIAEMKDITSVRFYRYNQEMKTLIDTVQTERRLSVLKPMIEELLNPMDTLAAHIEKRDLDDLEERIAYYDKKVKALDSLMTETVPSRVRRKIAPFEETFSAVRTAFEEMKNAVQPAEGAKIREAARGVEKALTHVLNGYYEPVYLVFSKKHINHGYIENGTKSWEQ